MSEPVLAIGPANYAGQAYAWAQAVSAHLSARAWAFSSVPLRGKPAFNFGVHKMMGKYDFRNPVLRGLRSKRFFRGATHVALDGFQPYYHLRRAGQMSNDLSWLRDHGYSTAIIAHGSDVRDPEAHMRRHPWSYFNEGTPEWRESLTASTREHRELAAESGLPVFYSTPDMGLDLPFGTWLPVCIDVDAWATSTPLLERETPRVLHVPSKRTPPIKGTQYIDPVLSKLHHEGAIEYIAPTAVPNDEMRRLVQSSDVVVDQLLIGSYGVASVEAMAAGRVLVGNISPDVAQLMSELPTLLEATPESLREVILSVRDRRDELRLAASSNVDFVRRWHDGRASAQALATYLGVKS